MIEYRSVPADHVGLVDDVDDRQHQHKVKVVFPANVTDRHGTQFAPHWASDSLRRNPHPPMLFCHNQADPIGRTERHQVIDTGPRPRLELVNVFDSFDANASARRAHHGIASGSLPGFSYGFASGEHVGHRSLPGVRVYTKARFLESSPVALPSIPGARATHLRTAAFDFGDGYGDASPDIVRALDALDLIDARAERHRIRTGRPRDRDDDLDDLDANAVIAMSKLHRLAVKASLR